MQALFDTALYPELKQRWAAIQQEMLRAGAGACLIATNVNLFYLTNRVYNGFCYLAPEGEPVFFVRRPVELSGERLHYIRKPEQIPEILKAEGLDLAETLMLELDELSYHDVLRLQSILSPGRTLNATTTLRKVRSIKSAYETDLLRHSGKLHAHCYSQIHGLYRAGMTDIDLSIEIERLFRRSGALGHFRVFGQTMELFMGSVIAGENAGHPSPYDFAMGGSGAHSSLPVGGNGTPLSKGTAVMVDMGGTFTGYISDMTRVFSVSTLPSHAYDAHQLALDIQHEIEAIARPGVAAALLYHKALEMVKQHGLSDYFMGHRQQAGFIGHGVGIQINESPVLAPRSKEILEEGHIFALEPKFVIPGVGAVGIENTYAVHASGIEKLTIMDEEIIAL